MRGLHEIQVAVTREKSIRYRLSNESWERGISNFFIDEIPMSFSTSPRLARMLAELAELVPLSGRRKTRHIIEIGAGLGILSKEILSMLRKEFPSLAKTIRYTISDGSADIVKELKQCPIFHPYRDCVRFKQIDATSWSETKAVDLAIAVNLCDSLNTHHIEYDKGRLYELQVSTHLPKNLCFLDTTQCPPKVLDYKAVEKIIKGKASHKKRQLLSRLSRHITEKWHRVPLKKSAVSKKDQAIIAAFIKATDPPSPFRFNYSPETNQFLKHFFKAASPDGMLAIFDFGQTDIKKSKDYRELISPYGATLFSSVCFPYIRWFAEQYGYAMFLTDFGQGKSQMSVLYSEKAPIQRKERRERIERIKNIFDSERFAEIYNSEHMYKKIRDGDFKKVGRAYDNMPDDLKKSFMLNLKLSGEYFKHGQIGLAKQHHQRIIERYGLMALPAYYVSMMHDYEEKKYAEILALYERLKPFLTYYDKIPQVVLMTYIQVGKRKEFIRLAKQCLATCRYEAEIIWNHYILIILLLLELNKKAEARKIIGWFLDIDKTKKGLVPKEIQQQIKEIHNTYGTMAK